MSLRLARRVRAVAVTAAAMAFAACGSDGSGPVVPATHPVVGLDRASVEWTTPWARTPPEQVVAITNSGDGALTGLSVGPPVYAAGQPTGWLSLLLTSGSAPASLTMRVVSEGLPPGTYAATVPVASTASGGAGAQRTIAVKLDVMAPKLAVDTTQLSLRYCFCDGSLGAIGASGTVNLSEKQGNPLGGLRVLRIVDSTGAPPPWLQARMSDSVAPAKAFIGVPFQTGQMPPIGTTSTAYVDLGSSIPGVLDSPVRITVKLTVSGPQTGVRVEDANFANARVGVPLPPFHVYYCEYYKGYCGGSKPFSGVLRLILVEAGSTGSTSASDRLVGQTSALYDPIRQGMTFDNVIISTPGTYYLIVTGGGETPFLSLTVGP